MTFLTNTPQCYFLWEYGFVCVSLPMVNVYGINLVKKQSYFNNISIEISSFKTSISTFPLMPHSCFESENCQIQ